MLAALRLRCLLCCTLGLGGAWALADRAARREDPCHASLPWRQLILETRFETGEGAVLLVDFMPFRTETPNIIRLVVGERGQVVLDTELGLSLGDGDRVTCGT